MNYHVYIESCNGWPIGDWGVSAWQGFRELGTECILFEQIEEVPLSKLSIVVACVETTHKFLSYMKIPIPKPMNIPFQLRNYAGREYGEACLAKLEWMEAKDYPIFIKPAAVSKQFIAGVIKDYKQIELFLRDVSRNTPIFYSEVIDIVSEYRCYVYDGKLQGVSWYLGDLYTYPNIHKVDSMIRDFKDQPAGYSIDLGVTKEGRTVLIECNDGYSLGNYGLAPDKYAKLLGRRWRELMVGMV